MTYTGRDRRNAGAHGKAATLPHGRKKNMSVFRVNSNILAMGSLRNLQDTNMSFGSSMNRLATGLRINSAADDPAGLIVSESFRAQIAGIDQALRNNQDAVNYTKTAEAALDEVSKLLRDARSLSIASSNSATLSEAQRQANQNQLNSIINSVTRIAQTTSYGTRKILDGSAGTVAASTSSANVASMAFSGVFNAQAITGNSAVTIAVTTAAQRATTQGDTDFRLFTFATDTVTAGSFMINGATFTTSSSDTISDVVSRINQTSAQTGVTASWNAGGNRVVLTSLEYGSDARVDFVDSNGVLRGSAGYETDEGVDAVANVTVDVNGSETGGLSTVSFASGSGLNLRDIYGNTIRLTEAGNLSSAAAAWGQVTAGSAQFQIGANADQLTGLSLGNFASTELGQGAVSNLNLSNIDITSAANASNALKVIDKAIEDISTARGNIGNFMRNVLESNVRSLGVQKENLSATESSIRDIDLAQEMTQFTKLQILQQSGISMLAQANQAPQAVLNLLRG